jgi:hypothetical protein
MNIQEYIDKVVATAPPLSNAQRSRLATLLGGASSAAATPPPTPEALKIARERAENQTRIDRIRRTLAGCGVCGAPVEAHVRATGWHEFTPLDAGQVALVLGDSGTLGYVAPQVG